MFLSEEAIKSLKAQIVDLKETMKKTKTRHKDLGRAWEGIACIPSNKFGGMALYCAMHPKEFKVFRHTYTLDLHVDRNAEETTKCVYVKISLQCKSRVFSKGTAKRLLIEIVPFLFLDAKEPIQLAKFRPTLDFVRPPTVQEEIKGLAEEVFNLRKVVAEGNMDHDELTSLVEEITKKEMLIQDLRREQSKSYCSGNVPKQDLERFVKRCDRAV